MEGERKITREKRDSKIERNRKRENGGESMRERYIRRERERERERERDRERERKREREREALRVKERC